MERFSNKTEEYWDQIKKELAPANDSEGCRFHYLEIGQLLTHGFSITLTAKHPNELMLKLWDAEYDNNRFDKGIFNLDRIAITDHKVELSLQESETMTKLLDSELALSDWKGIVLDGLFCQLTTNERKLHWNSNRQINENLTELVELLRNKVARHSM